MRPIVLRRVAQREYEESIEFYDKQQDGLGQEFREVIEGYFQRIANNPGQFPDVRHEVQRAVVVDRFPFVIHFVVEPQRIVILSVFHASRDPAQLKYRR